jgi:hypothetical protein
MSNISNKVHRFDDNIIISYFCKLFSNAPRLLRQLRLNHNRRLFDGVTCFVDDRFANNTRPTCIDIRDGKTILLFLFFCCMNRDE